MVDRPRQAQEQLHFYQQLVWLIKLRTSKLSQTYLQQISSIFQGPPYLYLLKHRALPMLGARLDQEREVPAPNLPTQAVAASKWVKQRLTAVVVVARNI